MTVAALKPNQFQFLTAYKLKVHTEITTLIKEKYMYFCYFYDSIFLISLKRLSFSQFQIASSKIVRKFPAKSTKCYSSIVLCSNCFH